MKSPPASLPKNWLAFRLGRLGDVVLCTGVLERLARDFGWNFHMVCKAPFAPLFDNSPCVGRVIAPRGDELSFGGFMAFCRALAAAHPGFGLLDLHGTLRSRLLASLWPGPVLRYPKTGLERRLLLATRGAVFSRRLLRHTVPQRYYAAVGAPPPPAQELLPRVHLAPEESAEAKERLAALFGGPARPVALHPFAAHPLKTWSPERWREMTRLLDERGIAWIALGSDKGPSPFAGDSRDLSNKSDLRQSCALLSLCRALISGDSGPMHLATAVGTPVMALFGPTTREWGFYPSGPRDMVFERPLACRPCSLHGNGQCPRNGECLDALPPVHILEAVLRLE